MTGIFNLLLTKLGNHSSCFPVRDSGNIQIYNIHIAKHCPYIVGLGAVVLANQTFVGKMLAVIINNIVASGTQLRPGIVYD